MIKEKKMCCGCMACKDICPKNAIYMEEDEEGFLYPGIHEELCIKCNLCKKTCSMMYNGFFLSDNLDAYVGRNKSKDTIYNSSSGGAFTTLYKTYLEHGYTVCGVKFNESLEVIHDFANDEKECELFTKSKYVQSNTNECYKQIAEKLKNEEKVLFSGVSCQVAAVYAYLNAKGIKTDNLVTINILCHGVPNQKLFDTYINEESKNKGKKIITYQFRYKDVLEKDDINSRSAKIAYEDGTSEKRTIGNDPFLRGYYQRLFYRPSCEVCPFTRKERISDFTIADAWNIEKIYPNLNPLEGVSLLLLNTTKAKEVLNEIENSMELIAIKKEWALSSQRLFRAPTLMNKNRALFFEKMKKMSFRKAVFYCTKPTIKNRLGSILPKRVRKFIKKMME